MSAAPGPPAPREGPFERRLRLAVAALTRLLSPPYCDDDLAVADARVRDVLPSLSMSGFVEVRGAPTPAMIAAALQQSADDWSTSLSREEIIERALRAALTAQEPQP